MTRISRNIDMNQIANYDLKSPVTQAHCVALDSDDPLASARSLFKLPPAVIYLDGNSLGAMPTAAEERAREVVAQEWGHDLIRSWNSAGWKQLPNRLGDLIAPLIGAKDNEVVVVDGTSLNLYKVLHTAISISLENRPQARLVISERSNFPTDLYIAQSLCKQFDFELILVESGEIVDALSEDVAVLLVTHVNYRTGEMLDMKAVNDAAHDKGILTIWDLCHSAGAVPVDLHGSGADFAVGCSYKYLNGGPGAPAFVWVHPRYVSLHPQPLSAWHGHNAPFDFVTDYVPAHGIQRYQSGTQAIVSLSLLECGLQVFKSIEKFGGMPALRKKSLTLTDLFIQLVQQECGAFGLETITPMEHHRRGSQVSLVRTDASSLDSTYGVYGVIQALIARGVIGDFRAGEGLVGLQRDLMRFGFTPLYVGFEDTWNAVAHLRQVLESEEWKSPQFTQRNSVT